MNDKIMCNVESCNYNNKEEGTCCLKTIQVSCTCNNKQCLSSKETVCQSFENTGSPITDNVYEVTSEL